MEIKRTLILIFVTTAIVFRSSAQDKPLIDIGMLGTWPSILPHENGVALSNNGRYVAYIIYNKPTGHCTLTVQDLRGDWKKTIITRDARILFFSSDSRQLCWQQYDSIWLLRTGEDKCRLLGVSTAISYPQQNKGFWMAFPMGIDSSFRLVNLVNNQDLTYSSIHKYRWLKNGLRLILTTTAGDIKLVDLTTNDEHSFKGVHEFALSANETKLVYLTKTGKNLSLKYDNLDNKNPVTVWTGQPGDRPFNYTFDKAGKRLAFSVQAPDGKVTIWYYKVNMPEAIAKVTDKITGFMDSLHLSKVRGFSEDGDWLLFKMQKELSSIPIEATTAPVDIWSYRDEVINPSQTEKLKEFNEYTAAIAISSNKVQLLQAEDERIVLTFGNNALLEKGMNKAGPWWPHSDYRSYWLISMEEGKRTLIKQESRSLKSGVSISVSPNGRWIYFWDPESENYFTLDPLTGRTVNLTIKVPTKITDDIEQLVYPIPVGVAGWYKNDSAVLVYDNFDIWKLDPSGNKPPVNITEGYGNLHGIKLRFVYGFKDVIDPFAEILLSAYDVMSKQNGFFKMQLNKSGSLQLLTMGRYNYYQETVVEQPFNGHLRPLFGGKGKNKRWIVIRQSATEYPNLFVSKDLKRFEPITNLQPQRDYNWLTAEPIFWRMYNGQLNTGVLYKPENFDSTQQYPVIFNYYQKFSQRCYQFPRPGLSEDNINIPWFVSRGYLVFTPDIQYSIASNSEGLTISEAAYNAVASAAEHLGSRPYIDKNRMGIQGHSFGGHETNGIITYTNVFAAAAEVAGYSDHVSAYLTLVTIDESSTIEKGHKIDHFNQRMGSTPWERPDLFRRNSPVQNADKIKTPLFIVHNKKDGSVNFRQGVEMYMALRRLGKPCWLLQYDNSGHTLNKNDASDYTTRLTQYFDHYLKGKPAPQWMTMNTLAVYKQKNNLYALDPAGNCMKDCKVCAGWNEK